MKDNHRKTVSIVCLRFAILWLIIVVLFESRYIISVFRHQPAFRDVLGTIYEEQIEGINFVILLVYLIPSLFAWAVYRRFRREY